MKKGILLEIYLLLLQRLYLPYFLPTLIHRHIVCLDNFTLFHFSLSSEQVLCDEYYPSPMECNVDNKEKQHQDSNFIMDQPQDLACCMVVEKHYKT
jgi:hypothetical protein